MVQTKTPATHLRFITKFLATAILFSLLTLCPSAAKALDVVDNLVYFPAGANGLRIYDVSNWRNPVLLNETIVAAPAGEVFVFDNYAYVVGEGFLRIVDVSDPRNPLEVGSMGTTSTTDVWVSGDYAYVAAWRNDVVVVDVSDPTNPTFAGKLPVTDRALGVQTQGNLAFAVDNRDKGVRIYDITNPRAARQIGFAVRGGTHEGLFVDGDRLYVASAQAGIHIYDIADPTVPKHLSEHNTPGYARNIYVENDIAYVADQWGDVRVLDVSNPTAVKEITWHETPGEVWNVNGGNGFIYVSDSVAGLLIFPQQYAPLPLPGESGNLGPPWAPVEQPADLCCLAGYLYHDGVPLATPIVTVTDRFGNQAATNISRKYAYDAFEIDFADTANLALQVGDTITLTATPAGLPAHSVTYMVKAGPQQFDIVLPTPTTYTRPVATINRRSHVGEIDINDRLLIEGIGQDSDNTAGIVAYEWRSSLADEPLSNESTLLLQPNALRVGRHQISFRVQDSEGEWSWPITFPLDVRQSVDKWTILLYLAGDYRDNGYLERQFGGVIENFDRIGSALAPEINVLVLTDSYGEGNTSLRAYSGSPMTKTLTTGACGNIASEMPMDQKDTLTTFLNCGYELFGKTHYYLSLADHGHGLFGTAWDHTSPSVGTGTDPQPAYLATGDIDDAIRESDLHKVDILHLDSCSMNLIETAYEVKDTVDYLISAQYLTWADFSYYRYINELNGEELPLQFARTVARKYVSSLYGGQPYTISILHLANVEAIHVTLSTFAEALLTDIEAGHLTVAMLDNVRLQTQVFESAFTENFYALEQDKDFYVDLVDWTKRIVALEELPTETRSKGEVLLSYFDRIANFIVESYSRSGTMSARFGGEAIDLSHAHGVSIFYPVQDPSNLLRPYSDNQLFEFTDHSQWDELLQALSTNVGNPGGQDTTPPAPIAPLEQTKRIYLPLIMQ